MQKRFILFPLFLLSACVPAADFLLVKDAQPVSEIVLGEQPTRAAQFAAFELQHAVKLITNTELPIVSGAGNNGLGKIFVGVQGRQKNWHGEEYSISFEPDGIHLEGNDNADFGKVDYSDPRTYPPLMYYYRSTAYAVYDFLEKGCGVRYYSFGDRGIAFQPRETLAVTPFQLQRTPKMEAFRRLQFTAKKEVSQRDSILLRHRWRENTIYGQINHNIYSIYYRYWGKAKSPELASVFIAKRPEYFAQNQRYKENSTIQKYQYPEEYVPSQLCYSSDGPVRYFAEEACKVYRGEPVPGALWFGNIKKMPGMPFYYPIQPDDSGNVCRCFQCLERQEKYTLSDYHFDWINRIATEAKKIDPEVNISTLSYNISLDYPTHVKLHPSLAIQMCMSLQSWFHPLVYKRQYTNYKKWLSLEKDNRPLTVWLYLLNPMAEAKLIHKYHKFFPVLYPEHAGKYFTEIVNDGIRGFFAETSIEQHELEGYLLARLAYDPSVGYRELIDEYFELYYGSAGAAMKDVYDTLEKIGYNPDSYRPQNMAREFPGSYIYGIHNEIDNWHLGTPERMKLIRNLLDKALALAATPLEKARVEDFIDRVWKQAEEGRVDFEKRDSIRKVPPPRFFLPRSGKEYAGNLDKADFTAAFRFNDWTDAYKKETAAGDLRILVDSTHLYLEYAENTADAFNNKELHFWSNGLECFLSDTKDGSYRQVFADVNGAVKVYTSYTVNGVTRFDEMNCTIPIVNLLQADSWRVRLALPLKELNLPSDDNTIYVNFIRVRQYESGESAYFSPIFTRNHAEGLYRMGSLVLLDYLPETRTLDVNGALLDGHGEKLPQGWVINPGYPGKVTAENGAIQIKAPEKSLAYIHFEKLFRADPGDKIIFEYTSSGTGNGGCAISLFHGQVNFIKTLTHGNPGTEEERRHRVEFTMPPLETFSLPATHFRVAFLVWPDGTMKLSDIAVTIKKTDDGEK